MAIEIILSLNKILGNEKENIRGSKQRSSKGKSLIELPEDYTVIDIETTGLDYYYDEIIEIGALKVRDGKVVDTFQSLVKPSQFFDEDESILIDPFIERLTGITNEMLSNAPSAIDVLPSFHGFVSDDILLGHNVNFDINFLYDASFFLLNKPFENNFIDLMRISKKVYPDFPNHKLKTLVSELNIQKDVEHRALSDCLLTHKCFIEMSNYIRAQGIVLPSLWSGKYKPSDLQGNPDLFDEENPLYKKHCVFTGKLERMDRKTAMQFVLDIGGFCETSVSKKTNYLILGNNDYCSTIKDGKSTKQKKAESLKLDGYDIEVISENVFYDLIRDFDE